MTLWGRRHHNLHCHGDIHVMKQARGDDYGVMTLCCDVKQVNVRVVFARRSEHHCIVPEEAEAAPWFPIPADGCAQVDQCAGTVDDLRQHGACIAAYS